MQTDHVPRPVTVPHGRYADQPIDAVPEHHAEWMVAMNTSVADKIAVLLERTSKLKRGSTINRPIKFNAAGQRHAAEVAARDRQNDSRVPK
jgi:hypothetical protein